jgi:hypothetical protein
MDESGEGFERFGALATGLVRLERHLGHGAEVIRPPDMNDDTDQYQGNQQKLIK